MKGMTNAIDGDRIKIYWGGGTFKMKPRGKTNGSSAGGAYALAGTGCYVFSWKSGKYNLCPYGKNSNNIPNTIVDPFSYDVATISSKSYYHTLNQEDTTLDGVYMPNGVEAYMGFYHHSYQITKTVGDSRSRFNGGIVKLTGNGYYNPTSIEVLGTYYQYDGNTSDTPSSSTMNIFMHSISDT